MLCLGGGRILNPDGSSRLFFRECRSGPSLDLSVRDCLLGKSEVHVWSSIFAHQAHSNVPRLEVAPAVGHQRPRFVHPCRSGLPPLVYAIGVCAGSQPILRSMPLFPPTNASQSTLAKPRTGLPFTPLQTKSGRG